MKADLSRDTYYRQHQYARVLMQQGRVLLDADWNEQVSILLEQTRTLASDLIGPHGGPGDGFLITCRDELLCDVEIGWGRYYVDGVACEFLPPVQCPPDDAPVLVRYKTQPDYPIADEEDPAELMPGGRYLMYLDVWERHLNHLQASHIREIALGGPDTATRSKVVCQVKAVSLEKLEPNDFTCEEILDELVGAELRLPRCLRARAKVEMPSEDPCLVPPTAQYRGAENQLYRVEIHDPGTAGGGAKGQATFKWSRDNGSIVFGIRSLQGSIVTLDSLGPDAARGLKEGDWVEIVDDVSELRADPRSLRAISDVDKVNGTVTLVVPSGEELPVFDETATTNPILRRWDQESDVIQLQESKWIVLEDGVQIWFEQGGDYKVGDYWQIPARTASADVLWPQETGPDGGLHPKAMPPRGIVHRLAPLRRIELDANGQVTCGEDCRCVFPSLCALAAGQGGRPPAEPDEIVDSLGTIEFEFETATPIEASIAVMTANTSRLREAVVAGELVRVDLRAMSTETGPVGAELAERRQAHVRQAYLEAGIPARAIPPTSISLVTEGEPRVETDMVRGKRLTERPRPGGGVGVRAPVNDVPGVGDVSASRLEAAGITDSLELSRLTEDTLVEVLSTPGGRAFPRARAAEILREARKLSGRT